MQSYFEFLNNSSSVDVVTDALSSYQGGELFSEAFQSEVISLETGDNNNFTIKSSGFNERLGFGLRGFNGAYTKFIHSNDITPSGLEWMAKSLKNNDITGSNINLNTNSNNVLYPTENPINTATFQEKVDFLAKIYHFAQDKKYVKQVNVTLLINYQYVHIIRSDSKIVEDKRPLISIAISIVFEKNGRVESGSARFGGRDLYNKFISEEMWQNCVQEALDEGYNNLEAEASPAGNMTVILGNGFPGILLHEAVGHGLEGDFNRKKTSVFSNLLEKEVASSDVTVIDDGTLLNRRGSLNYDDEGNSTEHNVLIQNGILKKYMQDQINANLMGVPVTGNGRRESYAHCIMPRMTNTYMKPGKHTPEEIISSVDYGIYAKSFSGGQVEITSGQFVFSASTAILIENGKLTKPIKGATIVGSGADALKRISMIGNDFSLDSGAGTCGKDGQSVPVGVGQPTLRLDNITVGGTSL